jgi:hypothetical protein
MGCMVPQSFAAGGIRSYLLLWAITGGTRYLGYISMTSAVLGEAIELAVLVIHGVVPWFQVEELLQLAA